MKFEKISEDSRTYTIQMDDHGDYEEASIEISTESLDPKNKNFSHCLLEINTRAYRTIDEHVEHLEAICQGLKKLKKKWENEGKYKKNS